jgi:DUF1707 SHOCT-like domain
MSDPSSLRIADADRERLSDELREHMLAGRLTPEEFEERLGLAYGAGVRDGWRLFGPAPDEEAVEARLSARREHRLARDERRSRRRGLRR